jgi:hypothetical protein
VRDLSSRGEGAERELFEERSNVGQVLFSPVRFAEAMDLVLDMQAEVLELQRKTMSLERAQAERQLAKPVEPPAPMPKK